jgi:four helix bundle protein
MQDYHTLLVWQKSHRLTIAMHRLTSRWDRREHLGLISQARRSSMSIPTNIAEGTGRAGPKEFAKFLQIAVGSCVELEYQLELARDLGIVRPDQIRKPIEAVVEVRRMLYGLIKAVRGQTRNSQPSDSQPGTS